MGRRVTIFGSNDHHRGAGAVKKGRHRRYEEARALKRSDDGDLEDLIETFHDDDEETKPEHASWAAEFEAEEEEQEEPGEEG